MECTDEGIDSDDDLTLDQLQKQIHSTRKRSSVDENENKKSTGSPISSKKSRKRQELQLCCF